MIKNKGWDFHTELASSVKVWNIYDFSWNFCKNKKYTKIYSNFNDHYQ